MNRTLIAIALFVVWSLFAGFIGWQLRDGSADTAAAKVDTTQATARADNAEAARTTDHVTATNVAKVEQQHVADTRAHEANFQSIEEAAAKYADSHRRPQQDSLSGDCRATGRGSADPEFVRIWTAANAGRFEDAEPVHPAAPDGGRTGPDARTE